MKKTRAFYECIEPIFPQQQNKILIEAKIFTSDAILGRAVLPKYMYDPTPPRSAECHYVCDDQYEEPRTIFKNPAFARETAECLYRVKQLHPFYLYGFVIIPDHCHFLMNVPEPETMANVVGTFKSGMTFNTGIPKMWQRRYFCEIISSNAVRVLTYIHQNPVKAGFVQNAWDYPWSSANPEWQVDPLGYE